MTQLCIVAGQRSGTTALQSALGATGNFANFKEIFHSDQITSDGSFTKYISEQDTRLIELATHQGASDLIDGYLDYAQHWAGGKIPLIDIKFNSWLVTQPFWSYPHQEPLIMQSLKQREAAFVFVRRRNLVAQILSEQIARQFNVWHNLKDENIDRQFEVNIPVIRNQARLIVQAENFFSGLIRSYWNTFEIDYESLYIENKVNVDLTNFIGNTFNIDLSAGVVTPIQKNSGKKDALITNFSEAEEAINSIVDRFKRTPFKDQI